MLFTSLEFLLLLLPLCMAVYYVLPFRFGLRNYWLLLSSLTFYAWGEPWFVFVMLGSICFNYIAAMAIERFRAHGCQPFDNRHMEIREFPYGHHT